MALIIAAAHAGPFDVDPVAARLVAMGMTEQAYSQLLRSAAAADSEGRAATMELLAGAALWEGGESDLAVRHFQLSPPSPYRELALAWSLYQSGTYTNTVHILDDIDTPQSAYLAGWSALRGRDPAGAIARWQEVPEGDALYPHAAALVDEVSAWDRVPYRSPALAGVLSGVLPGAGQAYTGNWGEASSALLVNGALIAAGWQLAQRELWFGLGLVAMVELGFYGGGITSAVGRAKRFNRLAWQVPTDALSTEHGPTVSIDDGAMQIQVR